MVETILVLPILVVLVVGVMDLAGAWRAYQFLTDLGREGVRNAVAGGTKKTQGEVETLLKDRLWDSGICPIGSTKTECTEPPQFIILWNDDEDQSCVDGLYDTSPGQPMTLCLKFDYQFRWLRGVLPAFTPEITFTSVITMRNEQ